MLCYWTKNIHRACFQLDASRQPKKKHSLMFVCFINVGMHKGTDKIIMMLPDSQRSEMGSGYSLGSSFVMLAAIACSLWCHSYCFNVVTIVTIWWRRASAGFSYTSVCQENSAGISCVCLCCVYYLFHKCGLFNIFLSLHLPILYNSKMCFIKFGCWFACLDTLWLNLFSCSNIIVFVVRIQ